jgi:subtilase family serine protease
MTLTDSNRIDSQSAWNDSALGVPFGGGGGFSSVLRAPFYQRRMHPWGDSRGYPDVSMAADGYPGIAIYCGLDAQGVCNPSAVANPFQALGSGTSAATPLFAGAVALADQQRDRRRRPRIGFANPLIYRQGRRGDGAVSDVVQGSNQVYPYGCCDAGPGYDLATGWGSIDASRLARGD